MLLFRTLGNTPHLQYKIPDDMYTITLKIIINFVAEKMENIYPRPYTSPMHVFTLAYMRKFLSIYFWSFLLIFF